VIWAQAAMNRFASEPQNAKLPGFRSNTGLKRLGPVEQHQQAIDDQSDQHLPHDVLRVLGNEVVEL